MSAPSSVFVRVAIDSIRATFTGVKIKPSPSHELVCKSACFVSLHNPDGTLRGCIGTIEPRRATLFEEIAANATSAAFNDPRFDLLAEEELDTLEVSVDVLHAPQQVESIVDLDPTIYGIIVESGFKRGVLLPNLSTIKTAQQQVEVAKRKAGIGSTEVVTVYRFLVDRYY